MPTLIAGRCSSLDYVVRGTQQKAAPLLCFLHGLGEGAPLELEAAMTLHGPLRAGNPAAETDSFVIVAPQLPIAGDLWHRHAGAVRELVLSEATRHGCDPARLYLSGFSYGGNGVFDLALAQPELWAAYWSVDPTRVPPTAIEAPLWLSAGDIARRQAPAYLERFGSTVAYTWKDEGLDHVASATSAYRDAAIYQWLKRQRRAS